MARLPVPGKDNGVWGQLLNDFLAQTLNADGTLKTIPQTTVQGLSASLDAKVNTTQIGQHSGVAALDADGDVVNAAGTKITTPTVAIPHNPDTPTLAGLQAGDLYTTS